MTATRAWPTLQDAAAFLRDGTGRGVKVAILDSGVEFAHPQLRGLAVADDCAITEEGLEISAVPGEGRDVFGHGTAIANIIHQVSPQAEVGSYACAGLRSLLVTGAVRN